MVLSDSSSLDKAFNKGLQQAFPPVMVQLLQALLEPNPSFSTISSFLGMDPMLTSTVLHITNSPAYGFTHKITDIQRAAIAIGTSELFKLVISLALQKKLYPTVHRDAESKFADWRLTLWSALAADAIASRLCPDERRNAYLAAMLKDLPLFLAFCRDEAPPFLPNSGSALLAGPELFAQELSFWGNTHPGMSHDVFLFWGFPEQMADAVRHHHDLAGIMAHAPLTRVLIYATRWAELLHAPDVSAALLVSFELSLAADLGLSHEEMDDFRAECAEKFNLLLSQLGIRQAKPETRLHDQSLAAIQSYHFLAIEAFSNGIGLTPQHFATTLQRQLSLFWDLTTWELYFSLPGIEHGSFFRCTAGKLLPEERLTPEKVSSHPGWQCLHLAAGNRTFGFLSVPSLPAAQPGQTALPTFLHVLSLHFEDLRRRLADSHMDRADFSSLPLAVARLDAACRIKDSTQYFLDIAGLANVPTNITAKSLLDSRLGISLPYWESLVAGKSPAYGWFTFSPEGHLKGTPTYLALYPAADTPDEYYLFLGDVTGLTMQQAIALSHPGYLASLFNSLWEQVYLIDASGTIFWAMPQHQQMVGKNLFSISAPPSAMRGTWTPEFLNTLLKRTKLQLLLSVDSAQIPHECTFSPIRGKTHQHCLLVARPVAAAKGEQSKEQPIIDPVTGLYNYAQFRILLDREAALAHKARQQLGLIHCDIDNFARINETYGFQTGDNILRRAATSIASACRSGKDHAARPGSDAFTLIITDASAELLDSLAEAIHKGLRVSCHGALTASIGLTLLRPGEAPGPRFQLAAQATLSAKGTETRTYWVR